MKRLKDRLLPANSLVVFEAVARRQSFTRAAEELLVSQAAVSRQVQVAEQSLGAKLFDRQHRKIKLTEAGSALFNAISMGLEHIARTCDEVRNGSDSGEITISSSVSFASYWLMSRIAKFRMEFPDTDVRLMASAKVRDLGTSGLDFAVRYGKGSWQNATADFMFGNDIFPVCSPAYLEEHGPFDAPSDLYGTTFLKLSQHDRNWTRWDDWFDAFGLTDRPETKALRFDNYLLLIHAAIRGEGMALCGRRFAEDMIQSGELVRPIDLSLESDFAFYLLRPATRTLPPAHAQFRDWLLREARTSAPSEGTG